MVELNKKKSLQIVVAFFVLCGILKVAEIVVGASVFFNVTL